ncbi:Scn10a [Symbiodinium sp. CCMP2592]|nr:Scn10a [Symbiodinium sp. CCMP2592]
MRWSEQISAVGLKGMQTQRHSKELSERIEAALKTEATRYRNLAQAAYAEIAADREADESLKRAHEARKREEAREAKRKQELDEKIRREQEKALREKEKLVPLKLRMAGLRADTIEDKVKFGHLAEQKVAKALDLKGSCDRHSMKLWWDSWRQDDENAALGSEAAGDYEKYMDTPPPTTERGEPASSSQGVTTANVRKEYCASATPPDWGSPDSQDEEGEAQPGRPDEDHQEADRGEQDDNNNDHYQDQVEAMWPWGKTPLQPVRQSGEANGYNRCKTTWPDTGTPVGNQILLLKDKQVEDGDTLESFDISSSATFILLRRAPLLSGAINREDLEHLLQDNLALQQAIEAYSNDLQYLPSDIAAMSRQVVEGLIASGSVPDMPDGSEDQWQELVAHAGKARQVAFSRALRAQLEKISSSLPGKPRQEPHPRDMQDHARSLPVPAQTGLAGKKDPSCYTQRLQPESHPAAVPEGGEPALEADAALRHVDLPQRPNKSTGPWRGAGQELKEFLHRQWSLCEGQDVG